MALSRSDGNAEGVGRDCQMTDDKSRRVFVIHGRNQAARNLLFKFLRAVGLEPIEWNDVIAYAQRHDQSIWQAVDSALDEAQAYIVLLTGDEVTRLQRQYESGACFEYQVRPNVLFEAGMACGKRPGQTIFVQVGDHRKISDLAGRHIVLLGDLIDCRLELIDLLEVAGCGVEKSGKLVEWADASAYHFSETVQLEHLPFEFPIDRFYSSREEGQSFKTILSMCRKSLHVVGVRFGTILQQLSLALDRLERDPGFYVEFLLLSPIYPSGEEIPWIGEVEAFNSLTHLKFQLLLSLLNLRKFIESIADASVRERVRVLFYYTLPTASLVVYDMDAEYGKVRVEPFLHKIVPSQRASFDIARTSSPTLYDRYTGVIRSLESCSMDLRDERITAYLEDKEDLLS